jgi:hypothetical protein
MTEPAVKRSGQWMPSCIASDAEQRAGRAYRARDPGIVLLKAKLVLTDGAVLSVYTLLPKCRKTRHLSTTIRPFIFSP